MLITILKYYLAIGLLDAVIIKLSYWKECNWKLFLLAIAVWPRILYMTLKYDHRRENE